MPTLDPAILARLRALQSWEPFATIDGTTYAPMRSHVGGADGQDSIDGYYSYSPGQNSTGDSYNLYDTSGADQGTRQFQKVNALKDFMVPFLASMGMQFLPGGAFGGAAGSAGGAAGGVSGLADGSALDAMYGGLDGGATLGGGATGGAALGTGAAGGAASGAGGLLGANGEAALGMGNAGAMGAGSGLAGLASGVGGALGGSGLLGAAATLAGALAGSKGTSTQQTTQRELPDYLKGPVNDLITRSQGLLNTQMPIAAQQGAQMRQLGGNLMNIPLVGNGFNRFAQR